MNLERIDQTKKAVRIKHGRKEGNLVSTPYGGVTRVRFEEFVPRVETSRPCDRRAPLSWERCLMRPGPLSSAAEPFVGGAILRHPAPYLR